MWNKYSAFQVCHDQGGTKLIKMCRYWLLKVIFPLNCLITARDLYTYVRAFTNVDVYIHTYMTEAFCKVNHFTDKNEE